MNPLARILSAALLALAMPVVHAEDTDGDRVRVGGEARLERGAQTLEIGPLTRFLPGDTVNTGDTGRVQWAMPDASRFNVLGGTRFKVEEFSKSDRPRAIYSLLKGGFRTLTGLISKRAGYVYKVNTPVATLGVRGTKYLAIFCKGTCDKYASAATGKIEDGLYAKVDEGTVIITNANGSIEIGAGAFGFVPADGSAPKLVGGARLAAFFAVVELDFDILLPGISVPPPPFELPDPSLPPRIEPPDIPPFELPASPS